MKHALIKHSPTLSHFSNLDNWVDQFFNDGQRSLRPNDTHFSPTVDIRENDKAYLVTADLPGIDIDDIKIEVKEGVLSISGKRETASEEESERGWHRERFYGQFSRSFRLSKDINEEDITAQLKQGVLNIEIPKSEKASPRTIKIISE